MELGRRDRAQPELIKLKEAIAGLVDELSVVNPALRNVVQVDCDESLRLWFDRSHFHRVMTNLIENALRYASNHVGSIRVDVAFQPLNDLVELDVRDDGPGVLEDIQDRLFEPFFTTRGNGTGLGLYIARELCDANGATLELMAIDKTGHFRIRGKSKK
jgi:two-component system sensor histidine kinase PilS (NtrC family)